MTIEFAKGHGTGNDFVLLLDPDGQIALSPPRVRAVCNRRFGIGGDGVLRVVRSERAQLPAAMHTLAAEAPWFMDYWNADGSLAEMCGNGIRVYARMLMDAGWILPGQHHILTRGGVRVVDIPAQGDIRVDMGPAVFGAESVVQSEESQWSATQVAMPNPHAVITVTSLSDLPVEIPPLDIDPQMYPDGANVEFVEVLSPTHGRMRVVERGAGETLSCGTGACAVAAVIARDNETSVGDEIVVDLPGGQLRIVITPAGSVQMSGAAEIVARGTIDEGWWLRIDDGSGS